MPLSDMSFNVIIIVIIIIIKASVDSTLVGHLEMNDVHGTRTKFTMPLSGASFKH